MSEIKGLYDGIKCPKCGKSHFTIGPSTTTCMYCPPVVEDGKMVSKDHNISKTECTCLECGCIFILEDQQKESKHIVKDDYIEKSNPDLKYYTTNEGSIPNPEWSKLWMHDAMYRGPSPYITPDYPYPGFTPSDVPDPNFCWHRLPCGICKLTNQPCPKTCSSSPTVTWNTIAPFKVFKDTASKVEDPKPDLENHSICKE